MSANTWRNRITRSNVPVDPEQLVANPLNWRIHPEHQQRYMAGALDELGWIQVVTIQEGTDLVIDGHMRIGLAISYGETSVPANYVDLTPAEADKALASLDAITAYAVPDRDQLNALYGGMERVNEGMAALLSQFNQHSALLAAPAAYGDDTRPDGEDGHLGDREDSDQHRPRTDPQGSDSASPEHDDAPESVMVETEGEGSSDGSLLSLVQVTIADPAHETHQGDVWRLGPHVLLVSNVFREWGDWVPYLNQPDAVFVPYPGPFVPLSTLGEAAPLVMVQPDLYVAGHILDQWRRVKGTDPVKERER